MNEIILTSDDYFHSLLADISKAKRRIDFETYIFNGDKIGDQLADTLIDAQRRGVAVRVLVDGAGTPVFGKNILRMEKAGVLVRVFHPFPWNIWQWSRANFKSSVFTQAIHLLARLNSRNHRKTCIIDNRIVYVGSANVGNYHISKAAGGDNWRDTGVKLTNVACNTLQNAYDFAWSGFPIEQRVQETLHKVNLNPIFRLNYSRHLRRRLYKSWLARIIKSKTRVWLTSAYFNPDYFLLRSLRAAAKHGVDVRILLPHQSDVPIMPMVATTFYTVLLNHHIKIYEYLPSILHAKIIIIDNWCCVGSSNLNFRSIRHDLEVDVNIRTSKSKQILERDFLEDIRQSRQISLQDLQKLPLRKKLLGRLLLFMRYFF